jgi:hypothetical protein
MKTPCFFRIPLFFVVLLKIATLFGQSDTSASAAFAEKGLFDSTGILRVKLRGDLRALMNDRSDGARKLPLSLLYTPAGSAEISIPVEARSRGHFRKMKSNCRYPPLLLHFPKGEGPHRRSIFREQRKLKLVMPCAGDEYVVREYLVYKLYNLFTPLSFRARLISLTLEDGAGKTTESPFYGILLEEEAQMAQRNGMSSLKKGLKPRQLQQEVFLTMAVFEYLIGNTDWSVQYLQNVKLLVADAHNLPIPVPYDFDHAGIVQAPYARPAEELQMRSTRERRYRGHCMSDLKPFETVLARFNALKKELYHTYESCALLDAKYLKSTLRFLDEFYETINTPKAWQRDFTYPCDPAGTGNIVIRGLRKE